MINELRERVACAVRDAVRATTDREIELPPVEDPPRPEFGDLAVPAALQLAREVGRAPREIAAELVAWLDEEGIEGVARWTVAGPGYVNAFLDKGAALAALMTDLEARPGATDGGKVVVEHTSINPNKAAHIGHLRNACLGDTLARILRYRGIDVEVQNYIDDTGVQVADVVAGLLDLRGLDAEAVAALPEPFDYYCWDLYTEMTARIEAEEELKSRRREVLVALEHGAGEEAEVGRVVSERISRRHLETMERLDVEYDLLVREGDVVALDLWADAFERLRDSGHLYFAEEGKNEGCWMMRLEGVAGFEELQEADKVLVRSDGTTTYVAKDIAYHLWKHGLLDRDFGWERFGERADGGVVWRSRHDGGERREFGGATTSINVIDVRQAYLQSIVALALAVCDAGDHTHFDYEMVALTPRTAEALGIPLDDEQRERAYVEMSGRRGHGVKADDLLDALEERAAREVAERDPELGDQERGELAAQIAAAAARYFLIKFTRTTVIAFDLEEALSFEGETGPYLQYSAVRAQHIFDKAEARWGIAVEEAVTRILDGVGDAEAVVPLAPARLAELLEEDDGTLWTFVLTLARFDRVVEQAAESLEISVLAKYAFGLAQQFSHLYHRYPILNEDDLEARSLRLLLTWAFSARLGRALALLGIAVPDRM